MKEITKPKTEIERARELTAETLTRWVENPALAIPAPMRLAAEFFWIEWQAIGRDKLSFASRIGRYHRDSGLTLEDLQKVFGLMNDPDRAGKIKFASDFFAEFAGLVATTIRDRRNLEYSMQRRAEDEQAKREAAPPDEVRAGLQYALTGIGQPDARR